MSIIHSGTRTNLIRRLFIQFCVFLVALGGIFPLQPSQAQAASFSINDIDTYIISGNAIYQLDGNNPGELNPKASLALNSSLIINNGLAISLTEKAFYAFSGSGGVNRLYKISETGATTQVATLTGTAANAVISPDNKYYYIYSENGENYLAYYDITTNQHNRKAITGLTSSNGGDILYDKNGFIWLLDLIDQVKVYQIDPTTAEVLRAVPMVSADGRAIDPGPRALSFLPDGKMYVGAGNTNTLVYELDPETLSYRFLSSTNIELTYDAASRVIPNFDPNPPELESQKSAKVQEKAAGNTVADQPEAGDTLLYTIQSRNKIADSLISNLVISDTIPEGLEYVPGTLTVDGQPVSDDQDDDQGEFIDSTVTGTIGDVTDTEWHNITFQVKVNSGQAGKSIENIAAVTGDNLDKPDEPKNAIDVYPLNPPNACSSPVALINGEFEKPEGPGTFDNSVAGGGYYYADTVPGWKTTDINRTPRGIIQIMDPARPSTIPQNAPNLSNLTSRFAELNADTNSMLYQELPTVPGQTIYWRLDHRGYSGVDTMSVNIGPVTDDPFNTTPEIKRISTGTTWETYSGSYTVPAGQTVTRFGFKAISTSTGALAFGNYLDNIFLGTEPCVVAEKTVSPEGEVHAGDVLTYEVSIKNNGGDIAANTVFEDSVPAGTEFVPGSIVVDGKSVDDSHYDRSRDMIVIDLGDVPNATQLPQGKTVQFKVKVLSGYGGIVTTNQAIIKYDNLLTNKSEEVVTNEVSTPIAGETNVCPAPVAMINGSFEQGAVRGTAVNTSGLYYYESEVPGWKTTDIVNGKPVIELWDWARNNPSVVKNWPAPPDGGKWAELNAFDNGMLYQDVKTTPGQTIYWRLSHMGRQGVDTMQLRIGAVTSNPYDTEVQQQFTDGNKAWGTYTGTYKVPAGQTVTRFGFEAVSTATGNIGAGNFIDDIFLGTTPCVTANKTASPQEVSAGDEVTYEIQIKNEGGDIAADASLTDLIPAGTEYVPSSMKLIQGSAIKDLTDADDTDEGRFDGSQVSIQLGNLANTSQLADGVTVQFKVKVLVSAANQQIKNKAQISYDNLLTGDKEQKESNETTTTVRFNPPVLESNKSAALQTKAAGNTDPDHPEPGDTLRYTIQARNTALSSFVSSLVISDDLPAGLQYVPGSLKVDGVSVTDDDSDQDGGFYTDGQVIGLVGDITDTEWHTLEFEAIIATGQAGKNIRNTAVVGGENVSTPSKAEEVVQVYPRHPVVESEKIAENLDAGKTNFEVGDTIVYTIRTRTVTDDAYISNLKITDTLPAGLEYVPGSLKVDGKTATDKEGDDNGHYVTGDVYGVTGAVYGGFGDIWDKKWHELQFHATIQTGQAGKDIRNIADVSGDNFDEPSRPEEEVKVYPRNPVIVSEKSATNLEAGKQTFEVGDTAIYSIRTRTVIGDTYMANLVISDTLPAGLEYIPGSLKVDGVSVTDDKDSDKGHYASGQVVGHVGDVWDTKWHTLEFKAKIVATAGTSIRNTGEITGDNIDQPSRPTDEIVVEEGDIPPVYPPVDPPVDPPVNPPVDPNPPVTPPVTPPTTPSPVIESRKTSRDINGGSIAVGDTLEYTISARNTVAGSYVSNLVIADILPEGLAYVASSLKVDGVSVTDNTDGDKGQYVNGKVSGNFGRITDTEWHTIEFKTTVKAGQAGKAIENIGEVTGDNVTSPEKPSNVIEVTDNENHGNPNPGGTGDSDGDSNEDPNGNSNEDSDEDSNGNSNGDSNGDSNTGAQTPDDHDDSTLGASDSTPRDPAQSGDQATNKPNGNKLPNTATNMYSYMLVGAIMLFAGLLLLRRRKKA